MFIRFVYFANRLQSLSACANKSLVTRHVRTYTIFISLEQFILAEQPLVINLSIIDMLVLNHAN